MTASRKLRPYFQAHSIKVLTNLSLRQILQKSDTSGRLMKWTIELSKFDISNKLRASVKGQALEDFIAEFIETHEISMEVELSNPQVWNLFIDRSSGEVGSRAGVILMSPEGHKLNYTIRFDF